MVSVKLTKLPSELIAQNLWLTFPGFDSEIIINSKERAKNFFKNKDKLSFLISCIDLTTLSGDDTRSKVQSLVEKALQPSINYKDIRCAAVCVYPARVADVLQYLNIKKEKLNIASVAAGFPSGQYHLQSRLLEIELAIADGANEIDVVINRTLALEENWDALFEELKKMREICSDKALLKVILAVGELKTYELVYKASWVAMLAGADFIKTSTGKETINATLEYTYVMCLAIKKFFEFSQRRVGFKPAGGIKTTLDALEFCILVENLLGIEWMTTDLFRLGASSLLDNILSSLESI